MALNVTSLVRTCDACPSQWSGETDSGGDVYICCRSGRLTASLDGQEVFNQQLGDTYHGFLTDDQMMDAVAGVLSFNRAN